MAGGRGWTRIIFVAALVAGWAAGADAQRQRAVPGDLRLDLQLLAENGRIVGTEPLLAVVTLTNISAEECYVSIGNESQRRVHFQVEDAAGQLVGPPRPDHVGAPPHFLHWIDSGWTLAPGGSRSRVFVVSEWYQFTKPGEYRVSAEWLGGRGKPIVLAGGKARITVDRFEASRLEAACHRLSRFRGSGGSSAWQALMSIRHDVVLPYLDGLARYGGGVEACLAIRRVGTPRAKRLIAELAARRDDAGEAARKALKMPLDADKPSAYPTAP